MLYLAELAMVLCLVVSYKSYSAENPAFMESLKGAVLGFLQSVSNRMGGSSGANGHAGEGYTLKLTKIQTYKHTTRVD